MPNPKLMYTKFVKIIAFGVIYRNFRKILEYYYRLNY